ncbi:MAG: glycosyltransferase family 9 protein [Ekhidna sp.]|nr:glycosyltransferase family 9 protein [Ekhidna sp.]
MKILIITHNTITDLLLITPIVRVLKTDLNADVYVSNEDPNGILKENPYLARIDNEYNSEELQKVPFDYVIDFQNSSYSKQVRRKLKGSLLTKDESLRERILKKIRNNTSPKKHIIDQYFDIIKPLGVKPDQLGIDFFIPSKDLIERNWLPESHQNGYVAVAINAPYETRKLPITRLIELCDRINKPIVLVGEKEDTPIGEEVERFFQRGSKEEERRIENLNKNATIFNSCGKFNLNQSASLLKEASWVFTYDSAYMHLASSFNKKIFSIWGNTSANEGFYPYNTKFTIFENNKLDCRPCSTEGFNSCPKGHFKCMQEVTFDFYLPD